MGRLGLLLVRRLVGLRLLLTLLTLGAGRLGLLLVSCLVGLGLLLLLTLRTLRLRLLLARGAIGLGLLMRPILLVPFLPRLRGEPGLFGLLAPGLVAGAGLGLRLLLLIRLA